MIQQFQYIVSSEKINSPIQNGAIFNFHHFQIQISENCIDNLIISNNLVFFGECFDFENPQFSNTEIINDIKTLPFTEAIKKIDKLTGFFIFIIAENDNYYVLNDASGQLETYIYNKNENIYITSTPSLISKYNNTILTISDTVPKYLIENNTCIFFKTIYNNISKLIPNFYYNTKENTFIRYFDYVNLKKHNITELANEVSKILENSIFSISRRKPCALALTAGWDSRLLFALSLKNSNKIKYYLLNHETEDAIVDAKIAALLTKKLNKDLNVINYKIEQLQPTTELPYDDNSSIRTSKIAKLMEQYYPHHILINGNVSEVARNFFSPLPKNLSTSDICYIIGVQDTSYELEAINNWLQTFNSPNYLLDAIYWEHKMSNWAGKAKSISNINNTVISPFNNRFLLALLLSSDRKNRDKHSPTIYKQILNTINPTLTEIPINPTSKNRKILLLKRFKVYHIYRLAFFKLRLLKF